MTKDECKWAMEDKQVVRYTGRLHQDDEIGMTGQVFKLKRNRRKVMVRWRVSTGKRYMTWVDPLTLTLLNHFYGTGTISRGKRRMRI